MSSSSQRPVPDEPASLYGPYPKPSAERAQDVAQRIEAVRKRITDAAEKAKKAGGSGKVPRLVAISKLHPPSSILAAYAHMGQLHFGENYVQEMADKARVLPRELRWHFVGGLQSNKGKMLAAIPNLYLLETLDSIKAANVLEKALSSPNAPSRSEHLQVYLQVNTSGEESKSGLPPLEEADRSSSDAPLLVELARHVVTQCPHLRFRGLMTIGAAANSTASNANAQDVLAANPDFARLAQTRKALVSALRQDKALVEKAPGGEDGYDKLLEEAGPDDGALELSMGMSADVEVATMAGSDNVRVGTDCFGTRPGSRDEATKAMQAELDTDVGSESQDK